MSVYSAGRTKPLKRFLGFFHLCVRAQQWCEQMTRQALGSAQEQHSSIATADCWPRHRQNHSTHSNPVQRFARTLRRYKSPFVQVNLAPIFLIIILFSQYIHKYLHKYLESFQAGNHHLLQTPMPCVRIVSDPSKVYFQPVSEWSAYLEKCITIKSFWNTAGFH